MGMCRRGAEVTNCMAGCLRSLERTLVAEYLERAHAGESMVAAIGEGTRATCTPNSTGSAWCKSTRWPRRFAARHSQRGSRTYWQPGSSGWLALQMRFVISQRVRSSRSLRTVLENFVAHGVVGGEGPGSSGISSDTDSAHEVAGQGQGSRFKALIWFVGLRLRSCASRRGPPSASSSVRSGTRATAITRLPAPLVFEKALRSLSVGECHIDEELEWVPVGVLGKVLAVAALPRGHPPPLLRLC